MLLCSFVSMITSGLEPITRSSYFQKPSKTEKFMNRLFTTSSQTREANLPSYALNRFVSYNGMLRGIMVNFAAVGGKPFLPKSRLDLQSSALCPRDKYVSWPSTSLSGQISFTRIVESNLSYNIGSIYTQIYNSNFQQDEDTEEKGIKGDENTLRRKMKRTSRDS